jgi:hypothetical protein
MRPPPVRSLVTAERVRALARALGQRTSAPTKVYLVGGATAVIEGWRSSTVDIDLLIEPDDQLTREIAALKERLGVNIEFASPADFLPQLPDWRTRSPFLFREGSIEVFHYDLYSQALAKLERGLAQDLEDVHAMVRTGAVAPSELAALLTAIEPDLHRFPAVEPADLRAAVNRLLADFAPRN